jgi:hypothetical protein
MKLAFWRRSGVPDSLFDNNPGVVAPVPVSAETPAPVEPPAACCGDCLALKVLDKAKQKLQDDGLIQSPEYHFLWRAGNYLQERMNVDFRQTIGANDPDPPERLAGTDSRESADVQTEGKDRK